jgi:myo-inositol-1(or 4)-monophosphatase
VWALDPIDGTGNFSHRIPHFAICVTFLDNGMPITGAIYNPMTDELFSFIQGEGVFLNGAPAGISDVTELAQAQGLLIVGHQSPLWEWGTAVHADLLAGLNKLKGLGSSNLDLAFLAAGRAEVVVYGTFSLPDGAAGVGMVRAAGGEVYDIKEGKPLDSFNDRRTVVAVSRPELYEKLRPLLHADLLS